jgi:hypothetical protein
MEYIWMQSHAPIFTREYGFAGTVLATMAPSSWQLCRRLPLLLVIAGLAEANANILLLDRCELQYFMYPNFDILVSSLAVAAATSGFVTSITGATPDEAYGLAQCRPDLNLSSCLASTPWCGICLPCAPAKNTCSSTKNAGKGTSTWSSLAPLTWESTFFLFFFRNREHSPGLCINRCTQPFYCNIQSFSISQIMDHSECTQISANEIKVK